MKGCCRRGKTRKQRVKSRKTRIIEEKPEKATVFRLAGKIDNVGNYKKNINPFVKRCQYPDTLLQLDIGALSIQIHDLKDDVLMY